MGNRVTASELITQASVRLDSLTGLRWWAAFAVFLYHMRVFAPLPEGALTAIIDYGYMGVTFFFVLSGFVLTWSLRPEVSKSTFYLRRFARIWPSHIVALLLALPVFYTFGAIAEGSFLKPFDALIISLSIPVIQAWWADPIILFSGNPAAWTLTVEALFYALFPFVSLVLIRFLKRGALVVALFAMLFAFVYRMLVIIWPASFLALIPLPIIRVPEFIFGMALAWAMRNGWRPRVHPLIGVGLLILAIAALAYVARLPNLSILALFSNEIVTVIVGVCILSVATFSLKGKRTFFDSRWQIVLGEWSFAFYLVHATIIYGFLRVLGLQPASWLNLLWYPVLLLVGVLVAAVIHKTVEKPFEKRLRSWKDNRDTLQKNLHISS